MRKINKKFHVLFVLGLTLLLAACGSAEPTESPQQEVALADFTPVVSATGEVVPEQTAELSIKTGGVVAEVLVDEGDAVEEGQVLIRLEGTEQLQAAVSAAQFELANAQLGERRCDRRIDAASHTEEELRDSSPVGDSVLLQARSVAAPVAGQSVAASQTVAGTGG